MYIEHNEVVNQMCFSQYYMQSQNMEGLQTQLSQITGGGGGGGGGGLEPPSPPPPPPFLHLCNNICT